MKIIVKQKDWSHFKTHYEIETVYEYEDALLQEGNKTVVDYDERERGKGNIKHTIYFAFTILKRNDNSLELKVQNRFGEIEPFVLNIGESRVFPFEQMDSGKIYTISLVE